MLVGVDDADDDKDPDDDKDTSFAGVHDAGDTCLGGVPAPNNTIMANADSDSDAEPNLNSIDPNEADDNSSKASVHSTGSHISVHSATG